MVWPELYGLTNAEAGELLEFESGVMGVVMNLEQDNVGAVLLGPTDEIKEGMIVRRTGRIASIKVGEQMLGRAVDPLGVPLDGLGKVEGDLTENAAGAQGSRCNIPLSPVAPSLSRPESWRSTR